MLQILKLAAKRERRRAVPFHHVCMYSALADAEFFCGRTDGGTVFNNIGGELAGALLNVSLQEPTRSLSRYASCICAKRGGIYRDGGRQAVRYF